VEVVIRPDRPSPFDENMNEFAAAAITKMIGLQRHVSVGDSFLLI
jgi:hypothetical protein